MAPTKPNAKKASGAKPSPSQRGGGKPRPYAKAELAVPSGPVSITGLAADFFKVDYLKDRELTCATKDGRTFVVNVEFTPRSDDSLRWEAVSKMTLSEFGAWRAARASRLRTGDALTGWTNEVAKLDKRLGLTGIKTPQILGKAASAALLSILSPRERQIFSATQRKYDVFITSKVAEYLAGSKKEFPPATRVAALNEFFEGKRVLPSYVWRGEHVAELKNSAMEELLKEAPISVTTKATDEAPALAQEVNSTIGRAVPAPTPARAGRA